MQRREFLQELLVGGLAAGLPTLSLASATPSTGGVTVAATWRGPYETDAYMAGTLNARWQARSLSIGYAVPLPTRAHGLLAEPGGGLLVCAARPGSWLLRCDYQGKVMQLAKVDQEDSSLLSGHAVVSRDGELIYTTEMDYRVGQGKIGVRDRKTLKKIAEWPTQGIDPHQLLLDAQGHLVVANGGVPRDLNDRKLDRRRMDSSLVRLDKNNGTVIGQWRVEDSFLSLRHMAWSLPLDEGGGLLGIAMQAEHPNIELRKAAPVLAVFDGSHLTIPTEVNDGVGYAGDISPAHRGGFAFSSNQASLTSLWHPGIPESIQPIVKLRQAYATAPWYGPGGGGVLVASAPGLVRWHPNAEPLVLPWPQPMALDNHWINVSEN